MKRRAERVPPLSDRFADQVLARMAHADAPQQRLSAEKNADTEHARRNNGAWRRVGWWAVAAAALLVGLLLWPSSPGTTVPAPANPPAIAQASATKAKEKTASAEPSATKPETKTRVEASIPKPASTPTRRPGKPAAVRQKSQQPAAFTYEPPTAEPLPGEATSTSAEAPTATETPREHPFAPDARSNPYLAMAAQVHDIRQRGERLHQNVAQLVDNHLNP